MKKIVMIALGMVTMAVAVVAQAADASRPQSTAQKLAANKTEISLADARSRIDKAIENPEVMLAIMQHLSATNQVMFLNDVNKAIGKMPGSIEQQTVRYLNANNAAIRGAAPGNTARLLAEVYATVSPESLTVISERFAVDLFARSADSKETYTDEEFAQIAVKTMKVINERCEQTDNGSPRAVFAILMFVRASTGMTERTGEGVSLSDDTPAGKLLNQLLETMLHDDAREMAKTDWVPSALGANDNSQSYEPLLAAADAGRRPDLDFTLVIAGPQFEASILSDLGGKNNDPLAFSSTRTPILDAVENPLIRQIPTLNGGVNVDRPNEPHGYDWQTTSGRGY